MAKSNKPKLVEVEETQLYNCEIRLGGSTMHTQVVKNVTQREMKLIKHIHGGGGVANVVPVGKAVIDETEELYHLAIKYSKTMNPKHGVELVEAVFRVSLDGFDQWNIQRLEADDVARENVQRSKNKLAARVTAAKDKAVAEIDLDIATKHDQQVSI